MRARPLFVLTFVLWSASAIFIVACGDDDNTVLPPKDSGADSIIAPFDSAAPETGPDAADAAPATATTLVGFNPGADGGPELPEAISFRDNAAYISLVARGEIVKIAYPSNTRTTYATLPVTPTNFTLGNAFDTAGNLYVAVAVGGDPTDAPSLAAAGIYKIPAGDGGTGTLWASAPAKLKFPNGLSFAPDGSLYVTDAADGAIYKFAPTGAVGTATPWKEDALLQGNTGDAGTCPGSVQAFPIGANGIHAEADAVWVVNTDKGTLVKVAVDGAGNAGAVTEAASDCAKLKGADGMRVDPRAPATTFIATNNALNAIVAIGRSGGVTTVLEGKPPFYSPADLAHVTGTSKPTDFLVVNASFAEAFAPPDAGQIPKPSLVKLSLP